MWLDRQQYIHSSFNYGFIFGIYLWCYIAEFKYDYQITNLMVVNRTGYETCKANDGAKEYESGDDKIKLSFGDNYFIGTYTPEDCSAGLKMAIKALAPK